MKIISSDFPFTLQPDLLARFLILSGLLFITSLQGKSAIVDTLFLNRAYPKINLVEKGLVITTADEVDPEFIWRKLSANGFKTHKTSVGFNEKLYWFGVTIKNVSGGALDHIIEVDNPQIDLFTAYQIKSDEKVIVIVETGDKLPFNKRLVRHRNFLVPIHLNVNESISLLFKIDKRKSSLSFPIYLWERVAHREKDYAHNLGYGMYFGFMLLCFIYATLTFLFLRKPIYLWYSLWIITSGLFVSTALGFSAQYFYPSLYNFNGIVRVYIEILSLVSLVYFLKLFLRIPELFPKINLVIQGQIYFLLFIVATVPVLFKFYEEHSFLLLQVINIIMIVVIGLLLYVSIGSYSVQKRNVLFFFSAFGAILVGSVAIILMEFGILSQEVMEINPYMIGSALELLLFSLGLTFQVKEIYDERNELSSRISKHQKEMMQAYVEGVEKERGRIAGELHDDIGSRLGNLRRIIGGIEHAQRDYIEKQVETLSSDVRSLSHQLAPATNRKGLAQLAEDLILDVQSTTTTQFSLQCYDVPERLSENITQQCYRILQEAINNILKHANAATADIQIFGHDQELVITIEDDGKGFDGGTSKKSIGLQQLKARTESVQGIFEISSSRGKGTQIMIRIPFESPT